MESPNGNTRFRGDRWFQNTVDRRTREELARQREEYAGAHAGDTDAELIRQLRTRIRELGYVPYAVDFLGAELLISRYGSWQNALRTAGFSYARGATKLADSRLYKEEKTRQESILREERRLAKERKTSRALHQTEPVAGECPPVKKTISEQVICIEE